MGRPFNVVWRAPVAAHGVLRRLPSQAACHCSWGRSLQGRVVQLYACWGVLSTCHCLRPGSKHAAHIHMLNPAIIAALHALHDMPWNRYMPSPMLSLSKAHCTPQPTRQTVLHLLMSHCTSRSACSQYWNPRMNE